LVIRQEEETAMSDEQPINEKSEVEGHGFRGGAPADEVEGHPLSRRRAEDAEAPSEDEAAADESREPQDSEVEGHPLRRS
jgi:hypothetical protein